MLQDLNSSDKGFVEVSLPPHFFLNFMKVNKFPPQQKLPPQLQKLDKKLKQAASMYEEQFLRQMVQAMRKSVDHSKMTKPSFGERLYSQQLDEEYVKNWIDRGGTGFGDMIYKELVNKFYPQLAGRGPKEIRPVDLSDRYQGMSKSITSPKEKKHTFNIQLAPQAKDKSFLQLPWEGKLVKQFEMENGEQVAHFEHPFGLISTFVFRGQMQPGLLNKSFVEGENFAQLSPEGQSLTWQIKDANSRKGSSNKENSSFN